MRAKIACSQPAGWAPDMCCLGRHWCYFDPLCIYIQVTKYQSTRGPEYPGTLVVPKVPSALIYNLYPANQVQLTNFGPVAEWASRLDLTHQTFGEEKTLMVFQLVRSKLDPVQTN